MGATIAMVLKVLKIAGTAIGALVRIITFTRKVKDRLDD